MERHNKIITDRLLLGFFFVIVLFMTIGIVSNLEMRTLSNLTRTLYNHPLVVSNAALAANVEIVKIHRSMKDVVLLENQPAILSVIMAVDESEKKVYQQLDIVADKILGEEGRKLEKETRKLFGDWRLIRNEVIDLVKDGQQKKAAAITMGKGATHVVTLENKTLELTSYARWKADGFMENAELVYTRINNTSVILVILGALLSMLVAFFTIRKVREAQKNVREHLDLVNGVIEGVGEPIYVKDTKTRLILANTATGKVWGQKIQDILGKSNNERLSTQIATKTNESDYAVIKTGEPYSFEEKTETDDGMQTYLSLKTPLRETSGNITGVIGISRNITERKRVEEQITASLREKEVLLREIHHRVKNNLQIISSLLNLQSASCGSDEASTLLRESKGRIDILARVHEKLYQTKNLAEVRFSNYVESFVYELFDLYDINMDQVRLILTHNDITLDIESAIACGLIINELITNSLKYAFPDNRKGIITVSLKPKKQGQLELCVGDDGIGLPQDIHLDGIPSLGLRLVRILVCNQLQGDIQIDRMHGSLFRMQFNYSPKE